ncbi:hypothetical protein MQE23_08610 [Streptomyces sp. HP-A2021]|uniref:hypothetical protein n=1 Tax=Streptomyces sp. HP-A2021 TaxID=2927875 RepID=UPI001FAF4C66|nr:hypothetical protein [Streptomyces sp. HP-A2021]UOB09113.1 hypothetical protein MQE23_08610 [Streptomyces sp. HP-A2021]
MTFRYTDTSGHHLELQPDTDLNGQQTVTLWARGTYARVPVRIPLDHLEELVTGLRDTGRQAAGGAP